MASLAETAAVAAPAPRRWGFPALGETLSSVKFTGSVTLATTFVAVVEPELETVT